MDSYSDHANNKQSHPDKPSYVKKKKKIITQMIILSLSIFSLFFSSQSYDYFVSISNIIKLNFNFNFNFKLFSYTTERNCIFLLCNGILVLIIQSSGVISRITPEEPAPKDEGVERFQENEKKGLRKDEILEEKRSGDAVVVASATEAEGDDDDDEDLRSRPRLGRWEEEEEEDEGVDADELNKKFEDFIKKMKQEILCA